MNENPSVNEFLKNSQALRVIQSCASTVKGNCRGNTDVDPNELTPLHRRTRGRNDSLYIDNIIIILSIFFCCNYHNSYYNINFINYYYHSSYY